MRIFLSIAALLALATLPAHGFMRSNLFPSHEPANVLADFERKPSSQDSDALFLTPYIEKGQIDEAQKAALITNYPGGDFVVNQLKSYSGFITVNKTTDSNMFFWFFPARVSNKHNDYRYLPKLFFLSLVEKLRLLSPRGLASRRSRRLFAFRSLR